VTQPITSLSLWRCCGYPPDRETLRCSVQLD